MDRAQLATKRSLEGLMSVQQCANSERYCDMVHKHAPRCVAASGMAGPEDCVRLHEMRRSDVRRSGSIATKCSTIRKQHAGAAMYAHFDAEKLSACLLISIRQCCFGCPRFGSPSWPAAWLSCVCSLRRGCWHALLVLWHADWRAAAVGTLLHRLGCAVAAAGTCMPSLD